MPPGGAWPGASPATSGSAWLVTNRGDSRRPHLPPEAEEALCFRRIDSRPARLDARRTRRTRQSLASAEAGLTRLAAPPTPR